jgi:hypothetical protein
MQTLANWQEWKDRCALALCGEDARRLLPGFVLARFSHFAHAYAATTNAGAASGLIPSSSEAWHRFETHFQLHDSPGGKKYKEWLFAGMETRGYSAQESVEAGASLLIRDVVREYLRKEHSSRRMVSMSQGVLCCPGERETLSVEDLLPGTVDTMRAVEDRDLGALARSDAEWAFAGLDRRERIALLTHAAGLSLAHPEAVKAAGCGRSTLNAAFHGALNGIAACVRERHPREAASVQASLACLVFEHVNRLVLLWGRLENDCASLCKETETPS